MDNLKAQKIRLMYDIIETDQPDISTSRLLSMTADLVNEAEGWSIDVSDVAEALQRVPTGKDDNK